MNQEKIGKFIATCRKKQNLTQEQLAEKLGITYKAVSKWECGRGLPDLSLLIPLSNVLDVSINEILSGEHISSENIKAQGEDLLIKYSMQKITKVKHNIIKSIIMLIIIGILTFIGYKLYLLNKYDLAKVDIDNIINTYASKEIVKPKLKYVDNYLEIGNLKIRNDFEDFEEQNINLPLEYYKNLTLKEKNCGITFTISNSLMMDTFYSELVALNNEDDSFDIERFQFLKQNKIENDLDLINLLSEKDNFRNNIFSSSANIKGAYSTLKLIKDYFKPKKVILIDGEYKGYMFIIENGIKELHILDNNKMYNILFYGEYFTNDYIYDLLDTIIIEKTS